MTEDPHNAALEQELERLRSENEVLRARFRVPEAPEQIESEEKIERPVRVLLMPDPLDMDQSKSLGPVAIANVAQTVISILRRDQPDIDWRAEHDLEKVPDGALCHQFGEAVVRMMRGDGPVPATFVVESTPTADRALRRIPVPGEAASEDFEGLYDGQLKLATELAHEGQAAHDAGAEHHAQWTLKAMDEVLARAKLGLAQIRAGREDWREALAEQRPEYDPRYRVPDDAPVGA